MSNQIEIDSRAFAALLADAAKPLDTWLSVMRFGMPTLLADQELLLTLLYARVEFMQEFDTKKTFRETFIELITRLNLKLVQGGEA